MKIVSVFGIVWGFEKKKDQSKGFLYMFNVEIGANWVLMYSDFFVLTLMHVA